MRLMELMELAHQPGIIGNRIGFIYIIKYNKFIY